MLVLFVFYESLPAGKAGSMRIFVSSYLGFCNSVTLPRGKAGSTSLCSYPILFHNVRWTFIVVIVTYHQTGFQARMGLHNILLVDSYVLGNE